MTVQVIYYAQLRQWADRGSESFSGTITTGGELWTILAARHGFSLDQKLVKLAVNDHYRDWDFPLNEGDTIVFIPPVAGG